VKISKQKIKPGLKSVFGSFVVNSKHKSKTCLNPDCKKSFTPGHYGERQLVCTGTYVARCPKCKGNGKKDGQKCFRCAGKGKYLESCKLWYKKYWTQTRQPPREIPDADFKKLVKAVEGDIPFSTLLTVARASGLRKGELLGLTWSDVLDREGKVKPAIVVMRQWDDSGGQKATKTKQGRSAYLLPDARTALAQLVKSVKKVVLTARIWETTESETWKRFTRLEKRLKVENPDTGRPFRFHDIRHTAAIRMLRSSGGDLRRSQQLLGHKNIGTTEIYTRQRPEEIASELEAASKKNIRRSTA
jgi:integrase